MNERLEDGCLCGAVRFQTIGPPVTTCICYCRFCQRVSGSAFVAEAFFPRENVSFSGGPISTFDYRSPEHGRALRVHSCAKCASTVGVTAERYPEYFVLYRGAFDDPSWFEPRFHLFTQESADWMIIPEDVKCYARHSLKSDGTWETPVPAPKRRERGTD